MQAIKEAFSNKSFNYLTLGFFVCGMMGRFGYD